ncbi:hypothetical protein M5D96_007663 [Drosophila gunungcola]|uniref:Uncharacterized protein n=1 Tax=Drosophila gunungcola TaxID=103775 RepID=A0A9P9YLJ4_9MUSC|nr:hypothetical protein M5D96_007663 [Drosophila gunungcola]
MRTFRSSSMKQPLQRFKHHQDRALNTILVILKVSDLSRPKNLHAPI